MGEFSKSGDLKSGQVTSSLIAQHEQDASLSRHYTPSRLVETGDSASKEGHGLPQARLAAEAIADCDYSKGLESLNRASCERAFPLLEKAIGMSPATSTELASLQRERSLTEDKWGKGEKIGADERVQYWQKLDQIENASNLRFLYGVTLNNYGFKFGDESAKAKGLELLGDAAGLAPDLPEFKGALSQARRNEQVDYSKSFAEGAVERAVENLPVQKPEPTTAVSAVRDWMNSKLGGTSDAEQSFRKHRAAMSNALQEAESVAPITTGEFIEKASKKLNSVDAELLRKVYQEQLH